MTTKEAGVTDEDGNGVVVIRNNLMRIAVALFQKDNNYSDSQINAKCPVDNASNNYEVITSILIGQQLGLPRK